MNDALTVFVTTLGEERKREYLRTARKYFGRPRLTERQAFARMMRFAYAEMTRQLADNVTHKPRITNKE